MGQSASMSFGGIPAGTETAVRDCAETPNDVPAAPQLELINRPIPHIIPISTSNQSSLIKKCSHITAGMKCLRRVGINSDRCIYHKIQKVTIPIYYNTECPVCLNELNTTHHVLECNHAMHLKCMENMIALECPVCRAPISWLPGDLIERININSSKNKQDIIIQNTDDLMNDIQNFLPWPGARVISDGNRTTQLISIDIGDGEDTSSGSTLNSAGGVINLLMGGNIPTRSQDTNSQFGMSNEIIARATGIANENYTDSNGFQNRPIISPTLLNDMVRQIFPAVVQSVGTLMNHRRQPNS